MAIAATQLGGLLACTGGDQRLPDGRPAIRAFSYVCAGRPYPSPATALNPYDPKLVPALLKLEHTGTCYAISAKRYVIYREEPDGSTHAHACSASGRIASFEASPLTTAGLGRSTRAQSGPTVDPKPRRCARRVAAADQTRLR